MLNAIEDISAELKTASSAQVKIDLEAVIARQAIELTDLRAAVKSL